MKAVWPLLLLALLLCGCSALTPRQDGWQDFTARVEGMNETELLAARRALLEDYRSQPSDAVRLRLSYVLSRTEVSLEQLRQARRIVAEVAAGGPHTVVRDLLLQQIGLLVRLQETQGEVLQLRAQLEMLKKIETDLSQPPEGSP